MNKAIITGIITLILGVAGTWLTAKKVIKGDPVIIQGEATTVPDTLALKAQEARFQAIIDSLTSIPTRPFETSFVDVTDCRDAYLGLSMDFEKYKQGAITLLKGMNDSLLACISRSSGEVTFTDTLGGYLALSGKVTYPAGKVNITPGWIRQPHFTANRLSVDFKLPLFDWPSLSLYGRIRNDFWLGVGVQPEVIDGKWLTKYLVGARIDFLRL